MVRKTAAKAARIAAPFYGNFCFLPLLPDDATVVVVAEHPLTDRVGALEEFRHEVRREFTFVREEFAAVRLEIRESSEETRRMIRDSETETRRLIRESEDVTRQLMRAGDKETRRLMREGDEETRREMRVLHEDLVERIKILGESVSGPRPRKKR